MLANHTATHKVLSDVSAKAFIADIAEAERWLKPQKGYRPWFRFPELDEGVHVEPPWARVVPVDPETLLPVPDGVVGLARIEDLANVDSAFAVQTQDRVVRVEAGFRLLGRAPGAPPRGCSIAIDEILSGRVP